jgi:hypothetical protein
VLSVKSANPVPPNSQRLAVWHVLGDKGQFLTLEMSKKPAIGKVFKTSFSA